MVPRGMEVYLAVEPVDMRLGFERLGGIVRERMRRELCSRALFVFFGRRRQTVKVLSWDGTGVVLWHNRLDRGQFQAPLVIEEGRTSIQLNDAEFEAFFAGLSIQILH